MASLTRRLKAKRRNRYSSMGRKRKNRLSQHSTKSYEELFAGFGAPGKSAPKKEEKKAASGKKQ
jgi:hypothetical protein